jgi:hypothetical protein
MCCSTVACRRKLLPLAQAWMRVPSCITCSSFTSPAWLSTPTTCTNSFSSAAAWDTRKSDSV